MARRASLALVCWARAQDFREALDVEIVEAVHVRLPNILWG